MKLPTPSLKQNAAVKARYVDAPEANGTLPFSTLHAMDNDQTCDALKWLVGDDLIPLVDEATGGIIGYVHRIHADRIAALLNVATL